MSVLRIHKYGANAAVWIGLLALAVLPLVASSYTLRLTVEIMIYAMLAMSLNLVLGFTGLPSLGQAAFYGTGAYAAGFVAKTVSAHALVTLSVAVLAAALVALVIGYLSVRAAGVFCLMLTLAFGQMLKAIAQNWTAVTGGNDGLSGIPRPVLGLEGMGYTLVMTRGYFYFALVCFAVVFLFLRKVVNSPLGRSFVGIRENERRMCAVGYNTFRYKLAAFVLAGAVAGLAGSLHAHLNGFVSAKELDWTTSATVLVMVIIGGSGNLLGSIFGAAIFELIQNRVSSMTPYWHAILGLLFILFALTSRQGLTGIAESLRKGGIFGGKRGRPLPGRP